MEKRKPTYDLQSFKAVAVSLDSLEVTFSALQGARELGLCSTGIVAVLQSMERKDFYKSMTSIADHTVWQDVYHVPWNDIIIYIKITAGRVAEFRLLSFKEK